MLITTSHGLYCPAGDFYIDPVRAVDRAVITHGHSDHARRGMRSYLAHRDTIPILHHRLGGNVVTQAVEYGEAITMRGVRVSLHPAGHVIGSAQVRIEHGSDVWVVSGDYKRQSDPLAVDFEPVKCNTFITESTFGLPIYHWPSNERVATDMNAWWRANADAGITSVVQAYALGKAQRVLLSLDASIGPVFASAAIAATNNVLRAAGHDLPPTPLFDGSAGALVIISGRMDETLRRHNTSVVSASGWNVVRDGGFVMSDHVDWPDLLQTIADTGAERILVTHGYTASVVRYLQEREYNADELTSATSGG